MGNPSNWISELKKVDFRIFQIFSENQGFFEKKRKKKVLLVLFVSEWTENRSRHTLQLFSSYKPIKTGKNY